MIARDFLGVLSEPSWRGLWFKTPAVPAVNQKDTSPYCQSVTGFAVPLRLLHAHLYSEVVEHSVLAVDAHTYTYTYTCTYVRQG